MSNRAIILKNKGILYSLESLKRTDWRFAIAEADLFSNKDIRERLKERDGVVILSLKWKDSEEITKINDAADFFLNNNLKFGACLDITNKNYIFIEEMIEFFVNKNCKNIFFCLPDQKADMIRFADIKGTLMELISKSDFKISLEGFPLCLLNENRDHATNIFKRGVKLMRCSRCDLNYACCGINREYLEKYGDEEFVPIDKTKEKIGEIMKRINKNSCIYVSDDELYYLLKTLKNKENFWDALEQTGYPIAIATEIINEMENEGLIAVQVNNIGMIAELKENENKIKNFSNYRIESKPESSQLLVKQEDIEKRVEYIIERCASGGNIVILGDDDFISLSIASKNHFDRIVVLEFDYDICKIIKEISDKEGYDIEIINHDLRHILPNRLIGKFDAFYTDSPYSVNGFMLFVSRGVELLKKLPKKHGFASFSCEMPEIEGIELSGQSIINKMRLFIERKEIEATNVIPLELKNNDLGEIRKKLADFKNLDKQERWYLGALARKEYLYHFLTTNQTRALIKGDFEDELYFTELALDFYLDDELKNETKKNLIFRWRDGD